MIGLGLSITQLAVRQMLGGSFNPLDLFANGEPGAWYDPSDLSTLYQDAAGTTPVTAVEQPVGLMLDKSKGLVLGPELVDSSIGVLGSSFAIRCTSTSTGDGFYTVVSNDPLVSAVATIDPLLVFGKSYQITLEISSISGADLRLHLSNGQNSGLITQPFLSKSSPGVYTAIVTPDISTRDTITALCGASGASVNFRISVRELPGNHAFQTTATSRPVLSARYNLLTKTEQFDDAVWTKANVTATANKLSETSASGTHSAAQTLTVSAGVQMIASVVVQAAERSFVGLYAGNPGQGTIFNLNTGARHGDLVSAPTAWSINSIGGGLFLCSITYTTASTATAPSVYICNDSGAFSYAGEVGKGLFVSKISLVPANQADLPYQRVNTATDYDSDPAKFPRYLRCDGIDDWMVTGTITPGTNKMTVFAGVRKLIDAPAVLMESNINSGTPAGFGAFAVFAPGGGAGQSYVYRSSGSLSVDAIDPSSVAPITNVLTGLGDISGDSATLRIDGTQVAQNTGDQGTGNYLAYPLYLFRRGGTSLPFSGNFYGGIIRFGDNLPIETIEQTEAYMAAKTGVTL